MRRRIFMKSMGTLGVTSFAPTLLHAAGAEPPPEVRRLRLVREASICMAPQYIAEDLLKAEGFAEVVYVNNSGRANYPLVSEGVADMTMDASPAIVAGLETSPHCVAIGGIHAGCYELFAHESVPSIRALKGRKVAVSSMGGGAQVFLASILAFIGLDPRRDVKWLVDEKEGDAMRRFSDGGADAFMAFAPQPQELRARGIGRVILDSSADKPWSQYFCCVLMANRQFVQSYPVATKRALRALLRAADLCASDPARVAGELVQRGHDVRFETALDVLQHLPYARWRYDSPDDTLRFYALRLFEIGMIKTSPNELVARHVDLRYLNQLRKELKA